MQKKTDTSNQTITLADGRQLGFAEYGDPQGTPVFFFHGWPGSRLAGAYIDPAVRKLHIRLISVDRPGRGLSHPQAKRTLLDWPDDIAQLADKLKLKKFSVIGISGGGPYALACAYKLHKRLHAVGVVCGLGPIVPFSQYEKSALSLPEKLYYRVLPYCMFLMPLISYLTYMGMAHAYSWFTPWVARNKPASDKHMLSDPHLGKLLRESALEGLRPPSPGMSQDYQIYCQPWGFDLTNIKTQVFIWHGELDRNVPVWMARFLAQKIPHARATFYPEMGHFLFGKYAEEILRVFK